MKEKNEIHSKVDGLTNSVLHFCFGMSILTQYTTESKLKICELSARFNIYKPA